MILALAEAGRESFLLTYPGVHMWRQLVGSQAAQCQSYGLALDISSVFSS